MEDHYIATRSGIARSDKVISLSGVLSSNAQKHGFTSYGQGSPSQGIVHVVGPELGLTLPGSLIVCGDSHTATHGAFGSLAFGVGASEIAHVLATQTIWQRKPKAMRLRLDGQLGLGVTAKDLILYLIGQIGARGGTGHVIEYAGSAINALSMEARMTISNMSIEAGAKAGIIGSDATTIAYLQDRRFMPAGLEGTRAQQAWDDLVSDRDAVFDHDQSLDVSMLEPTITWGTSPQTAVAITGFVPALDALDTAEREQMQAMMAYMGLTPQTSMQEIAVDQVFIGSCTNSRIEDLRLAAMVAQKGRAKVPTLVVPGSVSVQQQAQAEGLDQIFKQAGFQWASPGCSMCVAMNGDLVAPGKRCVSTSNRNFMGRQGQGSRTHLASPLTAAASALTGRLTDVREIL
jgi:3-isopropylmalate/(R)-2-methylmalate dehydratase large subunit